MKIYFTLGCLFVLVSFVFTLNLPINLTGNVINSEFGSGNIFFSFLFLVFGLALILMHKEGGLEKNAAQIVLESGKVIEDSRELLHIARKSKYELKKPVKEGIPVYDGNGRYITVIPIHKVTWRTSKDILHTLAEGKPSIKKRNYH